MCSYQRKRQRYLYEHYRCTQCGKRDERTVSGLSLCEICSDKLKQKRMGWIAQGLCSRCGKRPPVEGKSTCQHCRDYAKNYQKLYYKKKVKQGGENMRSRD